MGLAAELKADLAEAFENDLSDAVISFTLTRVDRSSSTYSPADGTLTQSATSYTGEGILAQQDQIERFNTHIEPSTFTLIVLTADISVEPKVKDKIVIASKEYYVDKVSKDPLGATYVLGLEGMES